MEWEEPESEKKPGELRPLGVFCLFVCLSFVFLGPHLRHMEVPRLGVQSELQLLATATATAMPDTSRMCNLHHSSQQCRILNPLIKARDQTCILMDVSSQVLNLLSHSRNSKITILIQNNYTIMLRKAIPVIPNFLK